MQLRTRRWLPAAIAPILVAAAISVPAAVAAVPPALPQRSPAQVVALLATGERVKGYAATLEQRSDLGLPDLSGLAGGSSGGVGPSSSGSASTSAAPSSAPSDSTSSATDLLGLLTGNQKARVQVSGAGLRVQLEESDGERSLIVNSKEAWTWDYSSQSAVHYTFPKAQPLTSEQRKSLNEARQRAMKQFKQPDPQAVAQRLIEAASSSTRVSLGSNVRVAGQGAYELVLTPKQGASLVRDVRVDVDARTGMVLRTSIYAKAGNKLAYQLGYTSLAYGAPAASAFTFTAPEGAKVSEKKLGAPSKLKASQFKENLKREMGAKAKAPTAAERKQLKAELEQFLAKKGLTSKQINGASVSGSGWASVIHLPAGTVDAANLKQFKSLLTPIGGGAYGLQSTLLSVRIDSDGSVSAGSVSMNLLG